MTQKTSVAEVKKNRIIYLILGLMCLLPGILYATKSLTFDDSLVKKISYLFISVSLFLLPFLFFKAKTVFSLSIIYVIFSPLEIIHLFMYKAGVSSGFMLLIFQTNLSEALEVLSSFSIIAIIYVLLLIAYIVLIINIKEDGYLLSRKYRLYAGVFVSAIFISLYVYTFSLGLGLTPTVAKAYHFSNKAYIQKFNKIYPIDIFLAAQSAFKTRSKINNSSEELRNFSFNSRSGNHFAEREIYVFVIGETARYANFGINGYHRNTSPKLSAINHLNSFQNVFTEANFTEGSLPILLTRATATNFHISGKEKSILEAFKEAGYSTYWISNQSFSNPFIGRIASEATAKYSTVKDFDSANNYDTSLYPDFDKVLAKNEKKQFIVIHTLGSHFRYNFRYSEQFRKFRPDFTGSFGYTAINKSNKEKLINTYDNSILFTDYFLAGIIKKIQQYKCVSYMYYISDHGENLFDNGNAVLHGGTIPTSYDLHVPLFVWTSGRYNALFPEKVAAVQHNVSKSISSSVTFHSLLDLSNIDVPDKNDQKSIASTKLKSDTTRKMLNSNLETVIIK